jgi:hypothetical protein
MTTSDSYSSTALSIADDGISPYLRLSDAAPPLNEAPPRIGLLRPGSTPALMSVDLPTVRSGSHAVMSGYLYTPVSLEGSTELGLSRFPTDGLAAPTESSWTHAKLGDTGELLDFVAADSHLVAAYTTDYADLVVAATNQPDAVFDGSEDFITIDDACTSYAEVDLAWDGSFLYVACMRYNDDWTAFELTVKRADLSDLSTVVWHELDVPGARLPPDTWDYSELKLAADSKGVSMGLKQGRRLRIYAELGDSAPVFDERLLNYRYQLARLNGGVMLVVGNTDAFDQVHSYWRAD